MYAAGNPINMVDEDGHAPTHQAKWCAKNNLNLKHDPCSLILAAGNWAKATVNSWYGGNDGAPRNAARHFLWMARSTAVLVDAGYDLLKARSLALGFGIAHEQDTFASQTKACKSKQCRTRARLDRDVDLHNNSRGANTVVSRLADGRRVGSDQLKRSVRRQMAGGRLRIVRSNADKSRLYIDRSRPCDLPGGAKCPRRRA